MENYEAECTDPKEGGLIETISKTDDIDESVDNMYERTPYGLLAVRDHWEDCEFCRNAYPGARDKIAQLENGVIERARQKIEQLSAEYALEFTQIPDGSGRDVTKFYADRIAAIVSTRDDLVTHIGFLMPLTDSQDRMGCEEVWSDFYVFLDSSRSSKNPPLPEYRQHLNLLSFDARRFVFCSGLASDIFRGFAQKFESMCIPLGIDFDAAGTMFTVDNPAYPIFQAFEMEVMESQKYKDKRIESRPFDSANPIVAGFVRMKMLEALLEIPIDHRILYFALDQAAFAYLQFSDEHSQGVKANQPATGAPPLLELLGEIRSEQNDGIDSLRAGQMEILRVVERTQTRCSAKDFLPLVESRLGGVYDRLHNVTIEQLARGEYFLSINVGEPDAMNSVVMYQANACENELYMRVFGRYLMQLSHEGIMDYLVDGNCKSPLLKKGKAVSRYRNLGTYCWYLRNDSKLNAWIESTLELSVDELFNESSWINDERNIAAHKKDYKSYSLAIFQERLYSPTGLLNCLHTKPPK